MCKLGIILSALLLLTCQPVTAAVYKCDFADKVVFSSQPCDFDVIDPSFDAPVVKKNSRINEFLVVNPYPGWGSWQKIKDEKRGRFREMAHIPQGQGIGQYKDVINQQWLTALPLTMSVERFAESLRDTVTSICIGAINEPIASGTEFGYNVVYGQYYCGKQRGTEQGIIVLYKVLRGKEAIYLVTREWRVAPFDVSAITIERLKRNIFAGQASLRQFEQQEKQAKRYLEQQTYVCMVGDFTAKCRG